MRRRYAHVVLSLAVVAGTSSTIVVSAEPEKGAKVGLLRVGANNLGPKPADDMLKGQPSLFTNDENNSAVERQQTRTEHERQLHESYQESIRPSNVRLLRKTRVLSHNSNLHNPRQVNPYTADYEHIYVDSTITEGKTRGDIVDIFRNMVGVGSAPTKEGEPENWTMAGSAAAMSGATFGIVLVALLLLSRKVHVSSQFCRCINCVHRRRSSDADLFALNVSVAGGCDDGCDDVISPSTPTAVQSARQNMCGLDRLHRLYASYLGSSLL